jgi:alkanesulfonate monooxygenase SsuD/methylene tetrahydromethanopterin reductase-like flavin-dependent oxidoreductase (luciferase family)
VSAGLGIYVAARGGGDLDALATRVKHWEELGLRGALFPDHLFFSHDGDRSQGARAQGDPFVLAASVAACSKSLAVGTIAANTGLEHPALIFRHFLQLAVLHGGHRVIAGIGSGWNNEEFEALGLEMPDHASRSERLRAAADLARQLFDHGRATIRSDSFAVADLPCSPSPATPPRLLIGAGSDAGIEVAARFADLLDLNGSSRRVPLNRQFPRRRDLQRRLTTTLDDLSESVRRLRRLAAEAGRPANIPELSIFINVVEICSERERPAVEESICAKAGIGLVPLSQCPYALVGPIERISFLLEERLQRLALGGIVLADGPTLDRLVSEVMPRLS